MSLAMYRILKIITLFLFFSFEEVSSTGVVLPAETYDAVADAQKIFDSKIDAATVGKLFVERSADQRAKIAEAYEKLAKTPIYGEDYNGGLYEPSKSEVYRSFMALFPKNIIGTYAAYMDAASYQDGKRFDPWHLIFTEVFILADEKRTVVVETYNTYFDVDSLQETINTFEPDYKIFAQELITRTRLPSSTIVMDDAEVTIDADKLLQEQPDWNTKRDTLNEILMTKPVNYVREVLYKFTDKSNGKTLQSAIKEVIKDPNVQWGYIGFADYVEDSYGFIARRVQENLTEQDLFATIALIINSRAEDDLVEIIYKYQELYNSEMSKDICKAMGGEEKRECIYVSIILKGQS